MNLSDYVRKKIEHRPSKAHFVHTLDRTFRFLLGFWYALGWDMEAFFGLFPSASGSDLLLHKPFTSLSAIAPPRLVSALPSPLIHVPPLSSNLADHRTPLTVSHAVDHAHPGARLRLQGDPVQHPQGILIAKYSPAASSPRLQMNMLRSVPITSASEIARSFVCGRRPNAPRPMAAFSYLFRIPVPWADKQSVCLSFVVSTFYPG
ncbi:hypothetical protein DFH06DRAFT_1324162 [Mycena polygramma]|nr:hypothetical protein DFH06DRAFT_1324162 [Mycena polygramma]